MFSLAWIVGKGSTPLDDWFQRYHHNPLRWVLYFFVYPPVLAMLMIVTVAVAASQRRWQLAATAVLSPIVAIVLVRLLKLLFHRDKGGGLAYPSGHTTVMVVLLGMMVLVAGFAWWAVVLASAWCLLGMFGVGTTFHYFTDTVGGFLLGSAIVCVAALTSGRAAHQT
jgi:membrane-associated phospholipid phosphatase